MLTRRSRRENTIMLEFRANMEILETNAEVKKNYFEFLFWKLFFLTKIWNTLGYPLPIQIGLYIGLAIYTILFAVTKWARPEPDLLFVC